MKKIKHIGIGIVIGVLLTVSLSMIPKAIGSDWEKALPFSPEQLGIIKQVKMALSAYQVDGDKPGKIDDDKMYYGAMKGMVASLKDPYTRFVDPKALEDEKTEMEGEYGGLGMYVAARDGKNVVVSPIEGTPADRSGIKPLDEIIKIDEENVWGKELDYVVKKLRGKPNTKVKLGVRRKNVDKILYFPMTREIIKIKSVRSEILEKDKIAYIKINQFMMKTADELESALAAAKKKNVRGVIVDLRNNPGGLLDICVDVTSQFVPDGLIVGTKGRFAKANEDYYAIHGKANKLPLVVLINEGSASASEIFAGAIKDHKRGTIVGTKSFGKGSVQTLFNLPDKSGVYVTIARYHTPSGFVLDKKGLKPDVEVKGEINSKNKLKDKQYQKALQILKQKIKTGK